MVPFPRSLSGLVLQLDHGSGYPEVGECVGYVSRWSTPVKQRQKFTLILMISLAVSLATGVSHSDSLADMGDEALVSRERGHVFEM